MGKKKNLVILGVIAVLIAVLAAAALLMPKSASVSGESEILITVDGKVLESGHEVYDYAIEPNN